MLGHNAKSIPSKKKKKIRSLLAHPKYFRAWPSAWNEMFDHRIGDVAVGAERDQGKQQLRKLLLKRENMKEEEDKTFWRKRK